MTLNELFRTIGDEDRVVVKHYYSDDIKSLFASKVIYDDIAYNYIYKLDKDLYDNKVIQINHASNFILVTITNTKEGDK